MRFFLNYLEKNYYDLIHEPDNPDEPDEPDDPDDPDGPTHPVTYPVRYDERTKSRLVGNTVRVYFEGED